MDSLILKIRMIQDIENKEDMTEASLIEQTLQLGKIVRNVIMYLIYFVYIEEIQKKSKIEGFLPKLFTSTVADNMKAIQQRSDIVSDSNN